MARNGGGIGLYVALLFVATGSCGRLVHPEPSGGSRGNSTGGRGADRRTYHGRLVIGEDPLALKGSERWRNPPPAADEGYQADMGEGAGFVEQRPSDVTVEQILKMEPKVECSADSMKLEVKNTAATPGSLFLIDRGRRLSPLSLSKLPSSCGYTVKSTRQDLVLIAPYDGCFVAQEEDNHVLAMLWLGIPVRMSCPQVRQCSSNTPMVTCYAEGMILKINWPSTDVKLNVSGDWEPLMKASQRCGFGVVENAEGVVVSVDYRFCLQKNDGIYTLEVSSDGISIVSCPSFSAQPEWSDEMEEPNKWGYEDSQPPLSEVPLVNTGLLYPQIIPEQPPPSVFENPWGNVYQQHHPFLQRFSEKPSVEQPKTPEGQVHQSFYPPQSQSGGKPGAPQGKEHTPVISVQPEHENSQPGLSQSMYWSFYHYPYPHQQPEASPLHPSYPEPVPEKKPCAPQGPGYPLVYPTYPPQPEPKPAVQKPGAPQGPGYPLVYPTYPPQPEPKPAVPKPGAQGPGYPLVYPLQPEPKPGTPQGPGYPLVYPTYPPQPEPKPSTPQGPGYPLVYPTYPPQPGPKPGTPQGPGYPLVYPTYPPQSGDIPAFQPAQNQDQNPEESSVVGGMVALQSSLHIPSLYCTCQSGFGNCCPQFAFHQHQHHHHILPVGGSDVPPVYTGLPFTPMVAFPGLNDGSGSPAPQEPNEPTSTPAPSPPPPENVKQLYFQPPGGSISAIPEGLPVSPENAYAYVDPQGASQYWSYSPLSVGQASGIPLPQHRPYMMRPPKEQYQPSLGNTNYAATPHLYSPTQRKQMPKKQPKPAGGVQPWPLYATLQDDAPMPDQNVLALPRPPPASRLTNTHDQLINGSSESNSYILLQRGSPGKPPFALRDLVHRGRNQGDEGPENVRPSKEKTEHLRWAKGTPTSFPNVWTRTISKQKVPPGISSRAESKGLMRHGEGVGSRIEFPS